MTIIADTLQAKKRLLEAGFTDEKAEGIIGIFNEADAQVATKLDLELFRKDIKSEMNKGSDGVDLGFETFKNIVILSQAASVIAIVGAHSAIQLLQ